MPEVLREDLLGELFHFFYHKSLAVLGPAYSVVIGGVLGQEKFVLKGFRRSLKGRLGCCRRAIGIKVFSLRLIAWPR